MVLSRNDKRKRKEGDLVDLMDPLAEPLKRYIKT
jgi:protein Jumonji